MNVYQIIPNKTALLIIDAQLEYFDEKRPLFTRNADRIKENLISLKRHAKHAGIKAIIIEHVHRADGSDVGRMGDFDQTPIFVEGTEFVKTIPELTETGDIVVRKTRYSAFANTDLESVLKSFGVDTVIVAGLMTNYCSVTTARHAHDLDYKVIFVADANAGPDMPDLGFGNFSHRDVLGVTLTTLQNGIADILTTRQILEM